MQACKKILGVQFVPFVVYSTSPRMKWPGGGSMVSEAFALEFFHGVLPITGSIPCKVSLLLVCNPTVYRGGATSRTIDKKSPSFDMMSQLSKYNVELNIFKIIPRSITLQAVPLK